MTITTETPIKTATTFQMRVTMVVEVDARIWADYHRVDIGLDQTLKSAVKEDVELWFGCTDAMNEKLGEAFTLGAKLV
tara:strand:+ start:185 stop:418 length:234 start_codon:yes stop_codon:yes gene_type:complete